MRPFKHQEDHLRQHWNKEAWGLFWEQGTGKTKPTIATAGKLFENGLIDAVLVVAPPGVERNWKSDELPKHANFPYRAEIFSTKRKGTKAHKEAMADLLRHKGLAILLISYPAFMTDLGKKTVKAFLTKRKCLYVLDESHNIKTPGAKRTKTIVASGKYAQYRRILSGTPMSQGPFDVYSQIRFLEDDFWKRKGIGSFTAFKHRFGSFVRVDMGGHQFDKLVEYKNLDLLTDWSTAVSDRVLKQDVLDLPSKLYSKRYFEMTAEQVRIYKDLRDELIYEFKDGSIVEVQQLITKILRLQQVLSGYVPNEDGRVIQLEQNPRLDVLSDITQNITHPGIIWCRFRHDVDQIMGLLGDNAVRYDGSVDDDQAEANKALFQQGAVQWFVGTAAKGGPGLTLHQAKTVIYYTNGFKLVDRLQSEDRAHRAGMDNNPVHYIDIVCPGTIDEHIVDNLRQKRDITATVLGDNLSDWI